VIGVALPKALGSRRPCYSDKCQRHIADETRHYASSQLAPIGGRCVALVNLIHRVAMLCMRSRMQPVTARARCQVDAQ
jgi:hypothetical protein